MMEAIDLNNYEAFLLDYFDGNLDDDTICELKAFIAAHPHLEINLDESELPIVHKDEVSYNYKNDLLKSRDNSPFDEVLNYIEGNFTIAEKIEFENKLEGSTELKAELQAFKKTLLIADKDKFENKQQLLKNDDQYILNNRTILYFENELSGEELATFSDELKLNVELQRELALIQNTKLVPEFAITYPDKESLKKQIRVISLFSFRSVAAAAAVVIVASAALFLFNNNSENYVIGKTFSNAKHKSLLYKKDFSNLRQSSSTQSLLAHITFTHKSASSIYVKSDSKTLISSQVAKHDTAATNSAIENKELESRELQVLADNNGDTAHIFDSVNNTFVTRYTNIDALTPGKDTEDDAPITSEKRKGFWRRAVRVAQQVNGLGLKALKGDEKENESYSLSFNSFSIEKK